jgi:hypothetical protein
VTAADRFQHELERLAEDVARQARRIANRRNITRADRAVRLAGLVNRARAQATALGELGALRQLEELTGRPVPARGVLPDDQGDRLLDAARTLLGDRDPLERVERMARSEFLQAAQQAVMQAVEGHDAPRGKHYGWTRQLNAGACERCTRWARNGRVWPATHPMKQTHPQCACIQKFGVYPTPPKPVRKKRK